MRDKKRGWKERIKKACLDCKAQYLYCRTGWNSASKCKSCGSNNLWMVIEEKNNKI